MGSRTLETVRDALVCMVGIVLTAHEALRSGPVRIPLLVLYSAMMGLPAATQALGALRGPK